MDCFLIDGGTTNTRVWMRRGELIYGPERLSVGVRDTAISGDNGRLKRELAGAFARISDGRSPPRLAVAAGMITSPLGLQEVPHCQAPAGVEQLAAGAVEAEFPEFAEMRWLLLPGVRSGPRVYDPATVSEVDIVRGEETELMGALTSAGLRPPLLYIHVGSHTKAIRVDDQGRITGGVSTLGGELLDAVSRHTILASAVGDGATGIPAVEFLNMGAGHAQRHGLTRALFLVRLLEQRRSWSAGELHSFLLGACIETDLAAIGPFDPGAEVAVSAPDAALPAWQALLSGRGCSAVLLGSADRERLFLAGIQSILAHREALR